MTQTEAKQAYALISLFKKLYLDKYGNRVIINSYHHKWAMIDVIESIGYPEARELVEYYFKTDNRHRIEHFLRIYDKLWKSYEQRKQDEVLRARLREETKRRMEGLE